MQNMISDVEVYKRGNTAYMKFFEGTHLKTEQLVSHDLETGVRLQGWARVALADMGYRVLSWPWDASAKSYRPVVTEL
jgi:hypothetical protein